MKKSLIFLLLLFPIIVSAQIRVQIGGNSADAPKETLDTAIVRIGYAAYSVVDTTKRDKSIEDYLVLEVGTKYSKYYSDNVRRRDSLMSAVINNNGAGADINRLRNLNMPELLASNNIKSGGDDDVIIKKLTENKLSYFSQVGMSHYEYDEPLSEMQWAIQSDTMTILSFLCQKATTTFRGREFEAWFAAEIPIFNGPWKFHGLPGLILKVSDSNNEFRFECVDITQESSPIVHTKHNYLKTSRKDYMKVKKKHLDDPIGSLRASMPQGANIVVRSRDESGRETTADENFRPPYNLIELD